MHEKTNGKPSMVVFGESMDHISRGKEKQKSKKQNRETGHSGLIIRPVDICQSPPVPASVLFKLAHSEATARHGHMASYFSLTKIFKEESLAYLLSQSSSRHPQSKRQLCL